MSKWVEKPLSGLARYINGFAFRPHHWGKEGLPIVRIEQLNDPDGYYDFCATPVPTDNIVDDGDLIFSWSATLKVALWRHGKAALNQHLFKVQPNPGVDKDYLYQLLGFHMEALAGGSHGSTMKHIKRSELDKYCVSVPDFPVQKTLSKILRAIDTQIEATQALIAKQERVRAGLMQGLFTRGVDAHGRLRPPREEAPLLYHQTELGWLPKGWEVLPARKLCSSVIDCKNRTPPITSEGHPVFRTPNVRNGKFVTDGLVHTDPVSHQEWTRRGQPLPGDILITREAPVGEVCIIPAEFSLGCLGQRMMLYRPLPGIISSEFMVYALQSQLVQGNLDRISGGSTVGHVKVGDVRDLAIPFCREPEQGLVATALVVKDAALDELRQLVAKLLSQKSGLMQDLLTGKVSVAPLLEGVAA
jgi:type I restriction enzyme, S subunit